MYQPPHQTFHRPECLSNNWWIGETNLRKHTKFWFGTTHIPDPYVHWKLKFKRFKGGQTWLPKLADRQSEVPVHTGKLKSQPLKHQSHLVRSSYQLKIQSYTQFPRCQTVPFWADFKHILEDGIFCECHPSKGASCLGWFEFSCWSPVQDHASPILLISIKISALRGPPCQKEGKGKTNLEMNSKF